MKHERFQDFDLLLGTESPLRAHRLDRFDLIRTATERSSMRGLLYVLARQAGIYHGWDWPRFHQRRVSNRAYVEASSILLGRSDLPYPVGMCTQAVLQFGVSPHIDCTAFRDNIVVHRATKYELARCKEPLREGDAVSDSILSQPARLAGCVAMVYWDGLDANTLKMREVDKGPYEGRMTVGGGHADRYAEVTGLEEVVEEAGMSREILYRASPLGVANQVVAVGERTGRADLVHYVNYMWRINLSYGESASNVEPGRMWETVDDEDLAWMKEDDKLTPIAECAIEALGII